MSNSLEGKIAVVTGGSTGIGLGIAKRFVSEGATVVITGRRQAELDAAVAEIGPRASAIRADVSVLADLDALYEEVESDNDRYVAGYDKLDKDVAAFNAKNNAYGFTSQAQFDAERNALIARQKKLDKLYKSIVKRDEIYEKKSAELEELNAQAASLNKELNIVERESEF